MFKIATWNVNSLRVRLPQVLDWLIQQQPDVLAIQETKVIDAQFPLAEIQAIGYHALFSGQKTYNGVALLSRSEGKEMITDLPTLTDPQRRILAITYGDIRVINIYVPNGAEIDSDKYQYKLNWLKQLSYYIRDELSHYSNLIILGDFNIAPADKDVYNPNLREGKILTSAKERTALQQLLDLGLQDTFRLFEQKPDSFSWWDYRTKAFNRNRGLRIDLILASKLLANKCANCFIDIEPRKSSRPSDHTPVISSFDI
ncbi:MAG: exodeoxyribonuclease III [Thiomargarita sp.]|nr:exodeoxyribonuclease III [Thiomargarita sp.]